jgi:hypothetical protein
MSCLIDTGSLLTCGDPPIGGVQNFVMLYNYTEWRAMVDAGLVIRDNDGTVSDIVNATGIQAFRFDVPDETALVLGSPDRLVDGGMDGYDHQLNMSIINTKQAQKNVLKAMAFEKCVAVVYKKNGTGEVYGDEQGLKSTTNTYNPNSPTTGSVIPVQLATSTRTACENRMPVDVFKTDAATTKALILGLEIPGV